MSKGPRQRSYSVSDVATVSDEIVFKILMLGDSGVGKSSLLLRYVDDTFSPTFATTIGIDFKIKTITINNRRVKLQIWDTAGQERFRTITSAYYRGAHGIIIVFDVTNKQTYAHVIDTWIPSVIRLSNTSNTVMLVGNKCDQEDKRCVSSKDAEQLVLSEHLDAYMEASACTRHNVDAVFYHLITHILTPAAPNSGTVSLENADVPVSREGGNCC